MTRSATQPLSAGDTIGIIGGGQLGRMLAMAAGRLGLKTAVLEPGVNCPAAQFANHHIRAAYDDPEGLAELADEAAIVTYEFENIPVASARLVAEKCPLRPGVAALEKSQDRLIEKQFLQQTGLATSPFTAIDSADDLAAPLAGLPKGGILKSRRLGYDGKGQALIHPDMQSDELEKAWRNTGGVAAILEGFVEFEREISVIAARGTDGAILAYDPAENVHREGILRTSTVPAAISTKTASTALEQTGAILRALDYVGVIGVEFFVTGEGDLVVNEIAPRVHNSGHWSEAACAVSQFEQHIRAIAGWPLADQARHSDCVMENLIGDDVGRMDELLNQQDILVHLYGKTETRPGRKMGHFTRLSRLT